VGVSVGVSVGSGVSVGGRGVAVGGAALGVLVGGRRVGVSVGFGVFVAAGWLVSGHRPTASINIQSLP